MAKGGLRSGLSSKGGKGHFDWSHGPKVSLSSRHLATAESFTAAPVLWTGLDLDLGRMVLTFSTLERRGRYAPHSSQQV